MTVSSETNRSGPYSGNGVTIGFNYGFRIVDAAHLAIIKTGLDGINRTLVLNTDYTVSGVSNAGGGTVTMASPPLAGELLTIIRSVPFTQETDLENQGPYFAETIETALDLGVMRDQQIEEELSRAVKIPVSGNTNDLDEFVASINGLRGRLLLPSATDPTTRDDGTPLRGGDQYFNTNTQLQRIFSAGVWNDAGAASAEMIAQSFVGDGTQAAFDLGAIPGLATNVLVWVGGVRQVPTTDYTVSGSILTFLTAPADGLAIDALIIAKVSSVTVLADGSVTDAKVFPPNSPSAGIDSNKLKFLQVGAGAVVRSVRSKLRDVVDARDFGVVADGATNDRPALLLALAASKEIILPPGVICIDDSIALSMNGHRLIGQGKEQTSILYTGAGSIEVVTATGLSDVVLAELAIDQNGKNGNCFNFRDCVRPSVLRSILRSAPAGSTLGSFQQGTGAGCVGALMQDCYLLNSGGHGMECSLGSQNRFINNRMENIAWSGINFAGHHYGNAIGNVILGINDTSGYGSIRASNGCTRLVVSDNILVGGARGLFIAGNSFSVFSNNQITSPTFHGIFMQSNSVGPNLSTTGNVVSGNMIVDAWLNEGDSQYAIHLTKDGTAGTNITYNEIIGNVIIDTRGPQRVTNAVVNDSGDVNNFFDNNRWNTEG